MTASIIFFPVSNGDMTLLQLDNGQTLLIDSCIRGAADDGNDQTPDVGSDLRDRLQRDAEGRLYVDGFLLSHPDQDHIAGLRNHFHLGPPDQWSEEENKILIREMWSSPMVFRRASTHNPLCEDAKAWNSEARRRVQRFRDNGFDAPEGDRILILGEDEKGKTDDIQEIVVQVDDLITECNRLNGGAFEARLLAPLPAQDDDEETALGKNESSAILRFSLQGGGLNDQCRFLTGGDASAIIWQRLWQRHSDTRGDWLSYDILQSPHHCSWRSLSFDSWTDWGEQAEVDPEARNALSQTRKGAVVVASSKPIKEEDDNPPHERAKREYLDILDSDEERFFCTDECWEEQGQALEFEINSAGTTRRSESGGGAAAGLGIGGIASQPRQHG